MSQLHGWRWWVLVAAMAPLVLPLAIYTRRRALRLAPAAGRDTGLVGAEFAGEPLRLLVLGESTAVGVGVSCLQYALVGQLAVVLAERYRRPVAWRALGENGISAEQACERLLPRLQAESVDLALVVFGVNDASHLTSLARWQAALATLAAQLQSGGAVVVFTGVPPLQHFTAIPGLLRWLLGGRAAQLEAQLAVTAAAQGAQHVPLRLAFNDSLLALDGYHPSSAGYRVWAQHLAAEIIL